MAKIIAYSEEDLEGNWKVWIPFDPEPESHLFAQEHDARSLHSLHKRVDSWGSILYNRVNGKWLKIND